MILVIDNYDSFTYNLVQYLGELGADVVVRRNDEITVDEIGALEPDGHRAVARPVHAVRRRESRSTRSDAGARPSRPSASASAIRRSARRTAASSSAPSA